MCTNRTMINTMQSTRHSFKLVLLAVVLVCFSQTTVAQATDQNFAYPKRSFKHDGKFGSQYSPEEDITIVTLEPMSVELSESGKPILLVAAIFGYQGKVPVMPKHI